MGPEEVALASPAGDGDGGGARRQHDPATDLPCHGLPWDASKPGGFGWRLVQDLSGDVQDVHAAGKTVTAIGPCSTGVMP